MYNIFVFFCWVVYVYLLLDVLVSRCFNFFVCVHLTPPNARHFVAGLSVRVKTYDDGGGGGGSADRLTE